MAMTKYLGFTEQGEYYKRFEGMTEGEIEALSLQEYERELMNELYNAGLITLGAVATSMISRKLVKDDLGVASTTSRVLRLAAAIG